MTSSRHDFRWALVVLVLSGAAALGHQLLWTRRMADLIGATGDSNTRVLGCFFLGLALGAAAAALGMPRLRRPWRMAGLIEVGIALLSLPALLVNAWSAPIWPGLGPEKLLGWQGAWLKSLLSILVVLPPAFLVGMTLPVLSAVVSRPGRTWLREGIGLYAAYTLGGGLGIVVVVGVALSWLGTTGAMLLMMGVNALAAGLCFQRDRAAIPLAEPRARETAPSMRPDPAPLRSALWLLSFISGAGILGIEVAGLHLLNLKAPLAFYTPAAVLFCVVTLLAGSAALVATARRFANGPVAVLIASTAGAGPAVAVAPLLFLAVTAGRSGIGGHGLGFPGSLLQLAGVTCVALGPAVLLAGMVFPLLISCIGSTDGRLPQITFAGLLATNGLGGLAGAELAHRLLLPSLGVHLALGALGGCYGFLALVMAIALKRTRALELALPIGSMALVSWLLDAPLKNAPVFLRDSTFHVIESRAGREGTLAVVERPDIGRAMFLDNHYMLGCTAAAADMQRQAHLPLLLHPAPNRVCFIGLGTGITAAGALKHGAVKSIDAVELSPLVAMAAARDFASFNEGIAAHPGARLHIEDGRTYIAAAENRFEVIIGDLFTPWRPGEARLCSLEQFVASKNALRPGGVFCQWLSMRQLTREQFDTIAATFRKAFGETYLFRNHFQTRSLPVGLVGLKGARLDWEVVARRCEAERASGFLRDPLCRHPDGVALLYLGTYPASEETPCEVNTLDNLRVELDAGRQLIAGDPADYFAGGSSLWLGLVQTQMAQVVSRHELPQSLRTAPRAALDLSHWQAGREAGEADSPKVQQELRSILPRCVQEDAGADWSLWPGLLLESTAASAVGSR